MKAKKRQRPMTMKEFEKSKIDKRDDEARLRQINQKRASRRLARS